MNNDMKHISYILTLSLLMVCMHLDAAERTAYVDDLVYTLDLEHHTAEVGVNPKTFGDVIIPEQISDGEGNTYDVTSIAADAFKGCKNLTSIVLPATMRRLSRSSLEGTGVYQNKELWEDGALYIDSCLIAVNKDILKPKYVVREGTRVIAAGAFQGNKAVTSVVIPQSVTRIDANTFRDCKNLQKVLFGQHVRSIGENAFVGSGIWLNEKKWKKGLLIVDSCLIAVNKEMPGKVQYKTPYRLIAEGAFAGNDKLQSIELSPLLEVLPPACFYNCVNLKSVSMPAGLKEIQTFAFYGCGQIKEINLPKSVQEIGA